jgi:hypothetical protein
MMNVFAIINDHFETDQPMFVSVAVTPGGHSAYPTAIIANEYTM